MAISFNSARHASADIEEDVPARYPKSVALQQLDPFELTDTHIKLTSGGGFGPGWTREFTLYGYGILIYSMRGNPAQTDSSEIEISSELHLELINLLVGAGLFDMESTYSLDAPAIIRTWKSGGSWMFGQKTGVDYSHLTLDVRIAGAVQRVEFEPQAACVPQGLAQFAAKIYQLVGLEPYWLKSP